MPSINSSRENTSHQLIFVYAGNRRESLWNWNEARSPEPIFRSVHIRRPAFGVSTLLLWPLLSCKLCHRFHGEEIYTYIIQHIKQTIRRISPYGCRFLGKCHGSWIRVFKSTQGPDFAIGMADIRVFRGSGFFVYCGVLTYFALFSHFIWKENNQYVHSPSLPFIVLIGLVIHVYI